MAEPLEWCDASDARELTGRASITDAHALTAAAKVEAAAFVSRPLPATPDDLDGDDVEKLRRAVAFQAASEAGVAGAVAVPAGASRVKLGDAAVELRRGAELGPLDLLDATAASYVRALSWWQLRPRARFPAPTPSAGAFVSAPAHPRL
jgi:hypothetical protein